MRLKCDNFYMNPPVSITLFSMLCCSALLTQGGPTVICAEVAENLSMSRIQADGDHFVVAGSDRVFRPWGVNYDHDRHGRLLEDYWVDDWETVESDFQEMKDLGFNVLRIHLQTVQFLKSEDAACEVALGRLRRLIELAEETGLYLDLTGLGNYHQGETPRWYDALSREERWETQAVFWKAVAGVGAGSSAIFCYDLMNEPVIGGSSLEKREWVTGELDGKSFVQRIALELGKSETREEVASKWVKKMTDAIREKDSEALITVGVIPWAHVWPNAKPVFYNGETLKFLDFVSVHFYPKSGEVDRALAALKVYDFGIPIVIEEMFPLSCSMEEMLEFIDRSAGVADGWMSFYWGQTVEEYEQAETLQAALIGNWLRKFSLLAPDSGDLDTDFRNSIRQ